MAVSTRRAGGSAPLSGVLAAVFLSLLGATAACAQQEPPPPPPPTAPPSAPVPPGEREGSAEEGRERPRQRLIIGPEFGAYLPTSARTRDAFGGVWTNIGVRVGNVRQANPRGVLAFEFQVLRNSRGGSRATLIPLTATYRRGLFSPGSDAAVRPYVGIGTGLYLADLRSDKYDVTSGFRGAAGVSLLAGMTMRGKARVEARYLGVSRVKGFDLSGFNLAAGFRF